MLFPNVYSLSVFSGIDHASGTCFPARNLALEHLPVPHYLHLRLSFWLDLKFEKADADDNACTDEQRKGSRGWSLKGGKVVLSMHSSMTC